MKARGGNTLSTTHFAVVERDTGKVVVGENARWPAASLSEVEYWFNNQGFTGKVAADGALLHKLADETMSSAQRDIVQRMEKLPLKERLELRRFFSTRLLLEKLGQPRRGPHTKYGTPEDVGRSRSQANSLKRLQRRWRLRGAVDGPACAPHGRLRAVKLRQTLSQ